jgi:hypothetical protein
MNALIFGSSGSVGSYISSKLESICSVFRTTHDVTKSSEKVLFVTSDSQTSLETLPLIDIVVWCQGVNCNDSVLDFDKLKHENVMDVNATFLPVTLNFLLTAKKLQSGAKLVVISSIWEHHSKVNKLSYCMSKSAVAGFVKSAAIELSYLKILINGVLPGVIDNHMSRAMLSESQISTISKSTGFDRLITLDDVYNAVKFLVVENTGITGQSITVDLGFTNKRII